MLFHLQLNGLKEHFARVWIVNNRGMSDSFSFRMLPRLENRLQIRFEIAFLLSSNGTQLIFAQLNETSLPRSDISLSFV